MALADQVLVWSQLAFAIAIIVVASVAFRHYSRTPPPLLKLKIAQNTIRLRNALLAFIASFAIFVPFATGLALGIPSTEFYMLSLLWVHMALILFAFWEYLLIARPQPNLLEQLRREGG